MKVVRINGVEIELYESVGEAISDKLKGAVQNTDWYKFEHPSFDLVQNFEDVKMICKDDLACYADSLNWSIMNKTELTASIYKFITHRVAAVKTGFTENFLPDSILNFIDWHFLLDCVLWFL